MMPAAVDAIRNAHILAVDDELANLQLISRLLATDGYTHVTTMMDPREILPLVLEREPDLILLDLHMPHLNGFMVLELLQTWISEDNHIPIIVLTADATSDARKRALHAGATDFLTKPFDTLEVLLRVRNHLQTRFLHQAARSRSVALEGQLATILSSVEEVLWSATPEGQLTFVSDAVAAITGRPASEFLGRDACFGDIVLPEDWQELAGWPERASWEGRFDEEYRIRRADGEIRWIRTRCLIVRDAAGFLKGIDGIAQDVTDRRHLSEERALRAAQEEVDRAKTEMVSIVSHELRTPLASFLGFSELLLMEDVSPDEQRLWITTIHEEAIRLSALVDDLLDLSRIEAGEVVLSQQPSQLSEIVERSLRAFDSTGDGARLAWGLREDVPDVIANPDKIGQVVTNLVSNALKYSPDGGPVTVSLMRPADETVRLSVTDAGLGIPEDEISRLFQRFHRVNTPERGEIPGTGLGLYICKQLIELHGGRIWVESAGPGHGSTFSFELPAAPVLAARGAHG